MILFDSREGKLLVLRRDWKLESMMRVLCVLCVCVSRDSERERERERATRRIAMKVRASHTEQVADCY